MMSTRRSFLVTGVLTAALSVVGLVGDVGAQTYSLTFDPDTVSEAATSAVKVTVTRTGTALAVTDTEAVTVARLDASQADETVDYTLTAPPTGTNFTATVTTLTWSLMIEDDSSIEGPETLILEALVTPTIGGVTGSTTQEALGTILIMDDDEPAVSTLTLTVLPGTLKESDTETKREAEIMVKTMAGQTFTTDKTIDLEFSGDATNGDDYKVDKMALELEAGESSVKTKLTALDDMVYDGAANEVVRVSAFIGTDQVGTTQQVEIVDNDQDPEDFMVMVTPEMIMEGEVATLTVSAEEDVSSAMTFMLTLAGTAMENSDYTIPSELMIPKDTKTGSVQLQAVMDGAAEMDETVMITVMAGGVMIGSVQTVTITGDADAADPPDEPEEEETDEPEEEETDEPEEEETDESEEERVRLPKVEYTATAGDASIMVSWTAVEGAARYQVGWSKDTQAETANSYISVRDGLSYTIENLANGTAYAVWVNAVDEDGYGGEGSRRPVVVTPMAAAEMPTPTPALPLFGAFALGAGLLAAGRARVRRQAQLRGREQRRQLTR